MFLTIDADCLKTWNTISFDVMQLYCTETENISIIYSLNSLCMREYTQNFQLRICLNSKCLKQIMINYNFKIDI